MTSPYDTLGSAPIPGPNPAGGDVRDDADFERLQSEIDKMNNPAAAGATDWDVVQRAASVLLAERGKDLLVACYLAGALMRRAGLEGLATGLAVVDDLLAAYWDGLFPPLARLRARRNALSWLFERVNQYVGERVDRDVQQDPEVIDGLLGRLGSIDAFLAQKDPEAPSARALISQIRTLPVVASAPEPGVPAAASGAGAVTAAAPTGGSASSSTSSAPASGGPALAALGTAPIVSGTDADRAFEQIGERLVALAGWRRGNDIGDAQAYRLNRIAVWAAVDGAPGAERGQTRIAGPIAELAIALDRLQSGDAPEDTIRFAEANLPAFPFWLDLNRASAQALARLGEPFAAALAEVTGATAQLLRRAPDLPGLAFADGKPFADGTTLEWIATLQRSGGPASAAGGTLDALAIALGTARSLAAEGDLEAAALTLQSATLAAAPEQRLRATIHLCELMLAYRPNAALPPFAEVLIGEVDAHALDRWAPPLALEALSMAHALMSQAGRHDAASQLVARIARIDAAAAVRLVAVA